LYANHAWSTVAGVSADDDLFSSDTHDVVLDSTRIASLKGKVGAARESMMRAIAKETIGMITV